MKTFNMLIILIVFVIIITVIVLLLSNTRNSVNNTQSQMSSLTKETAILAKNVVKFPDVRLNKKIPGIYYSLQSCCGIWIYPLPGVTIEIIPNKNSTTISFPDPLSNIIPNEVIPKNQEVMLNHYKGTEIVSVLDAPFFIYTPTVDADIIIMSNSTIVKYRLQMGIKEDLITCRASFLPHEDSDEYHNYIFKTSKDEADSFNSHLQYRWLILGVNIPTY